MIRKNTRETFWANNMQSKPMTPMRRRRRRRPKAFEILTVIVFLMLVCLLSFILLAGLLSNNQTNPSYTYAMQTKQALITTVTPTPFQPIADDSNQQSTLEPTPIDRQVPTQTPTDIHLKKPDGQVNILLLGSDSRPNTGGFRTDTIIWVSLNPKDGFVSAVSFPRDLFVEIPGMAGNRINVAFPRGGFDLLADTFELNFGVRPDHYILIDFNGFKSVINNLGGINVQAEKNLTDSCVKWINPSGTCSVGPGLVHMNGDVALWYARSRYSSNDIERARRTQEVVEAIFRRLMSLDVIPKTPELYKSYTTYVQTDITLGQVITLLPLANRINNNGDIRRYVVGFDHAYSWVTAQGAQVLVPYNDRIQELMIEALTLE